MKVTLFSLKTCTLDINKSCGTHSNAIERSMSTVSIKNSSLDAFFQLSISLIST